MEDLLNEMQAHGDEMNRSVDRVTGYLILAGSMMDSRSLGALLAVMDRDDAAILEAEKLRHVLRSIREKQRRELMRSGILGLLMVIVLSVLLFRWPARAQDAGDLATNTADVLVTLAPTPLPVEVTAEPTQEVQPPVVVVNQPPAGFSLSEFLTGLLSGAAVTLAAVFGMIGRLKNDTSALNAIEWLGKSIPVEALDKLNVLGRNLRDAGEVIDKVTDGKPNVPDLPGGVG